MTEQNPLDAIEDWDGTPLLAPGPLQTVDIPHTPERADQTLSGHPGASLAVLGDSPTAAMQKAEEVVRYMAAKCTDGRYISNIQGRLYPKVEWWTTVGMSLGLFPVEESSVRLDREDELIYEAVAEVHWHGEVVTRASAICSSSEDNWHGSPEYAIKSMAMTRATGKAYRIGLSALAVMANLEPTPAEEMDGVTPRRSGGGKQDFWHSDHGYGSCPLHPGLYFGMRGKMRSPAHPHGDGEWCNEDRVKQSFRTEANAILGKMFPADVGDRADQLRAWLVTNLPLIAEVEAEARTAHDWAAISHAARETGPDPALADDETPW